MTPWLSVQARRRPERVAIAAAEGELTYAQLEAAAREHAHVPGERVVLEGPPTLEFAVRLHACLLAGAAAVPVDPRLGEAEQEQRRRIAGPHEPDDVVLVVHTSGTTSEPKPVEISRANVEANAVGCALALGLDRDERWLCPMPLSHVGGLMILLRSVVYGTTVLLDGFDAGRIAERLDRGDATIVSLVPTMLARLLDAGLERPRALRCALLGGGPAAPALLERALAAGVPVSQTYGLTEATSMVTVSEPGDPFTAGWPLHGVTVETAADGEILVRGPVVAGGGLLRTGDLGALDDRGRLTITGRKADTIVTGGENVAPAEVEAVLLAHPAVADAAVFPRPHPEWGEAVVAAVVPRAGDTVDAAALRAWCRERLAPFKVPKAFEAAGELPRTASGKLLRRALR